MLPGADMVFNVTELSALSNILPYLEQSNVLQLDQLRLSITRIPTTPRR